MKKLEAMAVIAPSSKLAGQIVMNKNGNEHKVFAADASVNKLAFQWKIPLGQDKHGVLLNGGFHDPRNFWNSKTLKSLIYFQS